MVVEHWSDDRAVLLVLLPNVMNIDLLIHAVVTRKYDSGNIAETTMYSGMHHA